MADKELSEGDLKKELLKARIASQQAQAKAASDAAVKATKDEALAKKNAKYAAAGAAAKGVGSVASGAAGVAKDGLMTGVALASKGKSAVESFISPHGSGLVIAFLILHFVKWMVLGPVNSESDPYFGVRVSIDVFMFFYMWLIFFGGTKSLKDFGRGFAFAFVVFALEAIGMDGVLGFVAPSLITGAFTSKLFIPIFWPWYFYVAVWLGSDEDDLVVNLSKIGSMVFIIFVVTQGFFPTFLQDTAQRFGVTRSESITAAIEVDATQPKGYLRATWECIFDDGAFMELDACRDLKMNPPKDTQGLASGVYKKEPMIVSLSEDVLFESNTATDRMESNFLLNIFSPRKSVNVNLTCQVSGRKLSSPCSGKIIPDKSLSDIKSTMPPEKFTCIPGGCDVSEIGDYLFTVKTEIKNVVTEASLESLFIGDSILRGYLTDYSDPKNKNPQIWKDLNGDGQIDTSEKMSGDNLYLSLEKKWFPELSDKINSAYGSTVVISKSDPDLSQLALSIGDFILNPVKVGSQFELGVGLRNTKEGSNIVSISGLVLEIPDGTAPVIGADSCDGFSFEVRGGKNVLILSEVYLNNIRSKVGGIEKGFKAVRIASCIINVTSDKFLENSNKVESKFFLGKVVYDQVVKKDFVVRKSTATPSDATFVKIDVSEAMKVNAEIADKIKFFAGKFGVPESVALAVATKESGMKHYSSDGSVISNGEDWGVMQINEKVHSGEGCFSSLSEKTGMCNVDSCANTNVVDNVDCNIEAGIKLLKSCFDTSNNYPSGKFFSCNGNTYSGWKYALRCYNGWTDDCSKGDLAYVESVDSGIPGGIA